MKTAPYGTWQSPLTAELLASASRRLGQLKIDHHHLYWLESRPEEAGRQVIMQYNVTAEATTITPAGFNVRDRVHEYGGGDYLIHDNVVYFSNDKDQRLYRQPIGAPAVAITPCATQAMALRYADGAITPDGRYIICVRETHHSATEVINDLVAVPTDGQRQPHVIVSGYDFYACPRISRDGKQMVWLCWKQPQMPWDGCELWLADVAENAVIKYIIGYYSEVRPHSYNGGLTPNESEKRYWLEYKSVAKIS